MPKRKLEGKEADGRNCYTRHIDSERLDKAQQKLQCLIDCKAHLEDELEKTLHNLHALHEHIVDLECKIEKFVSEHTDKDCKNRMKEEILMIREQRSKAEKEVKQVKQKIDEKLRKMKHCQKVDGNAAHDKDECADVQ